MLAAVSVLRAVPAVSFVYKRLNILKQIETNRKDIFGLHLSIGQKKNKLIIEKLCSMKEG